MKSQQSMAQALGSVTLTMKRMNQSLNLPSIQKITSDFERLSETQAIKQEMFSESIDQVLADDNEADDTDELVNKIFDEVGLTFGESLVSAPRTKVLEPEATAVENTDDDLMRRLESLRKL